MSTTERYIYKVQILNETCACSSRRAAGIAGDDGRSERGAERTRTSVMADARLASVATSGRIVSASGGARQYVVIPQRERSGEAGATTARHDNGR